MRDKSQIQALSHTAGRETPCGEVQNQPIGTPGTLLLEVVTVPEAGRLWHKDRSTVYRALDNPKIVWRLSSGTILIAVQSLVLVWGKPTGKYDEPK